MLLFTVIACLIIYNNKGHKGAVNQEITTAYLYNISDKTIRAFTEPYRIENVSWSPDSEYFIYTNWDSVVNGNDKIRRAEDLKILKNPLEDKKYCDRIISSYWNKESNLFVEIKDEGDFWFKPGTETLHHASDTDKETNIAHKLTQDESNSIRNEFGLSDSAILISNADKTRFFYGSGDNDIVCCNIKTGKKELTLKTISGAEWTKKGDKIIYSIPQNGFESVKGNEDYKADLFQTYIYNFETKEKTKIADFYAALYCSPDDRYLILIPREFRIHETM